MEYNEKELIYFFNNVTIKLCIYDWKINFVKNSSEGYCWKKRKIIDIGLKNKNIKQLILHEIVHIKTCRFCNQKHNNSFWKTFDYLMRKFLSNEEINESNKLHRQYVSDGFYRLCYEIK